MIQQPAFLRKSLVTVFAEAWKCRCLPTLSPISSVVCHHGVAVRNLSDLAVVFRKDDAAQAGHFGIYGVNKCQHYCGLINNVQRRRYSFQHSCGLSALSAREKSMCSNKLTQSVGFSEQQKRFLWGWLNSVFNRVDESRIQEVGPDRACAEWLLRCGAGVKWDKGPDEWLKDYNSLPVGRFRELKIVEIDATDSAVMHIGFPHFRGLKNVRKAIFHRCGYMEDEAMRQLAYLKDTLEELQVSSCGNVTDEGILHLVQLKKLKKLRLYDFLEVRNRKHCIQVLKEHLPNCQIDFPFARESDKDPPPTKTQS